MACHRFKDAEELYLQSVSKIEEEQGWSYWAMSAAEELADFYDNQEDPSKAERWYKQNLTNCEREFSFVHSSNRQLQSETEGCALKLAGFYDKQNKVEEARKIYQRLLKTLIKLNSWNIVANTWTAKKVFQFLQKRGSAEETICKLEEIIHDIKQQDGWASHAMVWAVQELTVLLKDADQIKQAEELFTKLFYELEGAFVWLEVGAKLAEFLQQIGEIEKAESVSLQVLERHISEDGWAYQPTRKIG